MILSGLTLPLCFESLVGIDEKWTCERQKLSALIIRVDYSFRSVFNLDHCGPIKSIFRFFA